MPKRDQLNVAVAQYPIGQPSTVAEWREKAARWVRRGAETEGQLQRARNGLAGAYEEFFDREGYREIVELLQTLGVEE